MIFWLDHKIWGNGHGLKTPFFDAVFYWLSGRLYTWSGWFGCQLSSFQWLHPKEGEVRKLANREFVVFRSERCGIRVRVDWTMKGLADLDVDRANQELLALKKDLGTPVYINADNKVKEVVQNCEAIGSVCERDSETGNG